MSVSTIPHTTHRPLGRRMIAVMVAAVVLVALLTILVLRTTTSSAKPAAPAVSSPGSQTITQTSDDSSCFKVVRGTRTC